MMKLSCEVNGLSHRYQSKFLFQNLSFEVESGKMQMVRGRNGAGKTTLLKILSTGMEAVEGKLIFKQGPVELDRSEIQKRVALVGPYLELPEELTLNELIHFQIQSAPHCGNLEGYLERINLFDMAEFASRYIHQYSTGMKQKARLILSLTENRDIWILDEAGSNLDPESHLKFWEFVEMRKANRMVIFASNDPSEFQFADQIIDL